MSVETGTGSQTGSQKSSQKIIALMRGDPEIAIAGLAKSLSVADRAIKKQIEKLLEGAPNMKRNFSDAVIR